MSRLSPNLKLFLQFKSSYLETYSNVLSTPGLSLMEGNPLEIQMGTHPQALQLSLYGQTPDPPREFHLNHSSVQHVSSLSWRYSNGNIHNVLLCTHMLPVPA